MERSQLVGIKDIGIGSMGQQNLSNGVAIKCSGEKERSLTLLVFYVHLGLVFEENLGRFWCRSQVQWSLFMGDRPKIPIYEGQCDPPFTPVEGSHCYFLSYNKMKSDWLGAQLVCSWLHPWIDLSNGTEIPILCEILSNPPPVELTCPDGFFSLGESCYAVFDDEANKLSWDEAQTFCASLAAGGHLVEFETVEEFGLVKGHLLDSDYYCGRFSKRSNNLAPPPLVSMLVKVHPEVAGPLAAKADRPWSTQRRRLGGRHFPRLWCG
ncbi:unnamed protein product [Cyprideis torosa]|uniref:Uncharacterized protein n=1 Tax=Cyprideis torosa TaxID=163714 RepID=A0A7R8ZVB3_9CRUS|nr:unnamed protein product [Cyprideis torosa]CAG0902330.1 unnamed protein product [Cyprideis torosa]